MKICLVEKSLAGLLTAIYHNYHTYENIASITSHIDSVTLIDEIIYVDTNTSLARRVREGIIAKGGYSFYKDIADAYLSYNINKENIIFNYIKLFIKHGIKVNDMLSLKEVIDFNDILRKVRLETHRMHGFIRFQLMDNGVYYSFFKPDNDIIELVMPHFKARYNNQLFILHDISRNKMLYYDKNTVHKIVCPESITINLSEEELLFSELWKQYFNNVTIEERINPKLQKQYAPHRYRFFMNEF